MNLKDSRRLPAFPTGIDTDQAGMTLRDWFAGQAMNYLLERFGPTYAEHVVAERAYQVADAMLTERAK